MLLNKGVIGSNFDLNILTSQNILKDLKGQSCSYEISPKGGGPITRLNAFYFDDLSLNPA